jgi:hypothetical protein
MITNFNNFNNFSGKMGKLEKNTSQPVIQTAQKKQIKKKSNLLETKPKHLTLGTPVIFYVVLMIET